jgi:hypothetical protein
MATTVIFWRRLPSALATRCGHSPKAAHFGQDGQTNMPQEHDKFLHQLHKFSGTSTRRRLSFRVRCCSGEVSPPRQQRIPVLSRLADDRQTTPAALHCLIRVSNLQLPPDGRFLQRGQVPSARPAASRRHETRSGTPCRSGSAFGQGVFRFSLSATLAG